MASIDELNHIYDKTTNQICKKSLDLITSEIKQKIVDFSNNPEINKIDEILPELYFVNKIKLDTEIETGLIFCEECNRWFPIIETIPQMLPDQYRDSGKEIKFLKTNKDLLEKDFLDQELKPFNIE